MQFNRDRFVLSNGHGCALLYIMLHLNGYDMKMDDLLQFRQLHSRTPGHPESVLTPGVEVTTGPLGQGIANAVGMAIAEANLAARFNEPEFPIIDNWIFVFNGDGDLMEGLAQEAMSLAGHLQLDRLIFVYDDNKVTIDGSTDLAFTEDVCAKWAACGWHTQSVENGDEDLDAIRAALHKAQTTPGNPHLIRLRTTIGYSSTKAGTHSVHGNPLGVEEVVKVKERLGFDPQKKFFVPEQVYAIFGEAVQRGQKLEQEWNRLFERYAERYPEKARTLRDLIADKMPNNLLEIVPKWKPGDPEMATRKSSQMVLTALFPHIPGLIGGSADLTPSTLTDVAGGKDFQKGSYDGRYIRFGVREHAMCAILTGLRCYGGFVPYGGTFLNFIGYALGAVRIAALTHAGVIYVATHDSIGLGEDGPTHQPIEIVAALRAIPEFNVIRPADHNEVAGAYVAALTHRDRPTCLCLSRQNVPHLWASSAEKVLLGAYTVHETGSASSKPDIIIVGTGSEVSICIEAANKMPGKSVRVISMPCWNLFEKQKFEYKRALFPAGVPIVSVEALSTLGWSKYSHVQIGMHTFGLSAPYKKVYEEFGITGDNIAKIARSTLEFYELHPVPDLVNVPCLSAAAGVPKTM